MGHKIEYDCDICGSPVGLDEGYTLELNLYGDSVDTLVGRDLEVCSRCKEKIQDVFVCGEDGNSLFKEFVLSLK